MTLSHCPKCGNALRKNAAFCGFCGADINAPPGTELPAPQPEPNPAQPEVEVCQFCGKLLRPGARFCAGCGKAVGPPDAVGVRPDGEVALESPTPEESAPMEFPLSGLPEAMDEPQIEFEEVAVLVPEKHIFEGTPLMPVSTPNPAKQAHLHKIWIGIVCLVVLIVMAVQILPGLFGSIPSESPDATIVPSLPIVPGPTEGQPTPEATPEQTVVPTLVPTLQPTAIPFTATVDPDTILQPLMEDFSTRPLSSDWVKTGVVGAVIENMDETRGGVLRLNSDVDKGILTYSPALPLANSVSIQLTLVSTSSALNLQLFDSETQVAVGAVPLMSVQFKEDTAQVVLVRADGAEVTLPLPTFDGKEPLKLSILVSPTGMVNLGIDGVEVFTTTSDMMAVPPSGKVRFALTGSAVIDDLHIQLP